MLQLPVRLQKIVLKEARQVHRDDSYRHRTVIGKPVADDEKKECKIDLIVQAFQQTAVDQDEARTRRFKRLAHMLKNQSKAKALIRYLQKTGTLNLIGEESERIIHNLGNVELKSRQKTNALLVQKYWAGGVVYCTCGNLSTTLWEDEVVDDRRVWLIVNTLLRQRERVISRSGADQNSYFRLTWITLQEGPNRPTRKRTPSRKKRTFFRKKLTFPTRNRTHKTLGNHTKKRAPPELNQPMHHSIIQSFIGPQPLSIKAEMSDSEEDWCAALRGPQCDAKAEVENDTLRTDCYALPHWSKRDRTQHFYAAARMREGKERKRRRRAEGSHVQSLKKVDWRPQRLGCDIWTWRFLVGKTAFLVRKNGSDC